MNAELWAEIRRLFAIEKLSRSAIAGRLRVDRKTVRRALTSEQTPPSRAPAAPRASKLDAFKSYLQNRLKEYPELNGVKLLIEIKKIGYQGGYSQLKRYLQTIRPEKSETFLRIETLPGEQAQVDWANCGSIRVGSALRNLSCFVMVLSYSRMIYLEFTLSQCLEDFLACHVRALRFFKGIPKKMLYDNLKAVVVSRVGKEIRFNPKFMDFAGYCLFEPVACGIARGNEKGKVESGIKYIRGSFLEGREIVDWADLQREAVIWRDTVANVRIHGTTRQRPVDRYAQEESLLQALPGKDYDASIIRPVKATNQAFVIFDVNAYSVPWQLSSKILTLKATSHEISVFDGPNLIASHPRSYEKHLYFEKPEHRQGLLASKRAAQTAKLNDAFLSLGDLAKKYLEGLLHAELHLAHHLQKIMDMVGRYGKTEVLQAINHALQFKAFGAPYIENIITQQRARRGLSDTPPIQITKKPQWTQLAVEDQNLELYDDLFKSEQPD